MTVVGTVREWHEDLGWGVIDSPETPGGCWAHFSHVAVGGYRTLRAGQRVTLEWASPGQDGFPYRAERVWPEGAEPVLENAPPGQDGAFSSTLTLTFDEEG